MELYGYNHLITAGCSNSSRVFGTPWSDFLMQRLDVPSDNFMTLAAAGAGVGNYADRVMSVLANRTKSLVIVQVTDLRRLTLGLRILDGDREQPSEGLWFNKVGTYTWAYEGEKNHFNFSNKLHGGITDNELTSMNISRETCDFISKEIVMSDYTLRTSLMSLYALKQACDMTDSYLLLFPWFQNWNQMWAYVEYPYNKFSYIEQSADSFLYKRNFPYVEKDCKRGGHYGSEAHRVLCDEYIIPKLKSLFEKKELLI